MSGPSPYAAFAPHVHQNNRMEKALAAVRQIVEDFKAQESYWPPAKPDADANRLEMQCEGLDRQIDDAVYELYAEEEKRIVESANPKASGGSTS